jgi:hypothetical protein
MALLTRLTKHWYIREGSEHITEGTSLDLLTLNPMPFSSALIANNACISLSFSFKEKSTDSNSSLPASIFRKI